MRLINLLNYGTIIESEHKKILSCLMVFLCIYMNFQKDMISSNVVI